MTRLLSTGVLPNEEQLELPIPRQRTPDRNFDKGGRSFYFFDFDDNVALLDTQIFLFNKRTGEEFALSTRTFSSISHQVGKPGPYEEYEIRPDDDRNGSFRRFRDRPPEELSGREQPFIEDLVRALDGPERLWKGPSWEFFSYAVFNHRPVAIITARGHHPEIIRQGLAIMHERGFLAATPNYLAIFTVTNREVRSALGDPQSLLSTAELKKRAILESVATAMRQYGVSDHHRFGMSDDDPTNIARIIEAFRELKQQYPANAFFVIDSKQNPVIKNEVLEDRTVTESLAAVNQLTLFG